MRHITNFVIRSVLLSLLIGVAVVLVNLLAFPSHTFAAEIVTQTKQVLPPGGNSCPQLQATDFSAFIYDNALHSFEFNVSDSSYVAVLALAGDTGIPFNLMTRRENGSALRYHVDIAPTSLNRSLPITITLLSANQGQSVCLSTIVTVLAAAGSVTTPVNPPITTPGTGVGTGVIPKPVEQGSATSTGAGTTTETSTSTPPVAGMQSFLENMCADGRAPAMWFILLVMYAAFVWAATSGKIRISFAERLEWTAAAIVVPLILLLALWYFPENCRAEAWVPAVGIVIAIAALLAVYGTTPPESGVKTTTTKVISLPAGRTDPSIKPKEK